jgi:hypothetical protein
VVWLKSDFDGAYKMTVTNAAHDAVTNSWSYTLKDTLNADYGEWVAETKLTAANPSK